MRCTFLSITCLLVLTLLAAGPAVAATVSCPSSCACLLPSEAKEKGYPGYCSGTQRICGYDALKNAKYCYENPSTTTVPQVIVTARQSVTTTPATPAVIPCPSTCSCMPDEKAQGAAMPLALCGGTKTYCGSTASGVKEYCYLLPMTATTSVLVTTPPATIPGPTESCTPGCRCLAPDKADPSGYTRCSTPSPACSYDPLGRPMYCYAVPSATMVSPVPADATLPVITSRPPSDDTPPDVSQRPADGPVPDIERRTPTPAPNGGFVSAFGSFFASLFGGSSPPRSSSLQPVPCNGIMTNVMTDPDNCGSCGTVCSSGSCVAGQCADVSARVRACGPMAIQCSGTCTYIRSDENNCGSCGYQCATGEYCCSGRCTNLLTTENCGSCGNTCGSGDACCSGKCTDSSSDRLNCGSCGHPCPGSYLCERGVCIDRTCEEALFAERKANTELRAQLDRLSERFDEMEHRYNYCLWLTDFYKEGCLESLGDHCTTPPDPTEDVPFVTEYEP